MKIRNGFVTNSSSTNFLIISKNEITFDFLFQQLTAGESNMFEEEVKELCNCILDKLSLCNAPNIIDLKDKYGIQIESIYEKFKETSCLIYEGQLSGDSSLECFFACTPFEFLNDEIYINGLNCLW